MQRTALVQGDAFSVYEFRCNAGPADRPFAEMHARHSLSYVRRGSFGCRTGGREYELVAGSWLVGRPGQEYTAMHEHHGRGDECLSFKFSAGFVDAEFRDRKMWEAVCLPPRPELVVLGELAQAAAEGGTSAGVDEAALMLLEKFAAITSEKRSSVETTPKERRRAVEAALWLEENAAEPVALQDVAREHGLSPYHFLRSFSKVVGVTPHQYLLRVRLRRAARLLAREDLSVTEVALESGFADLSNFVRTFGRAAGVSPARFRRAARSHRKIFQERFSAVA